ncbi:tRNA synthetases class I (M)-domain-containing protein [Pseudomassariella vexata]|uniref:Probable methionine--tRNA ligase, mitochondrial n=1 Tax=Pseudomassariella vexata TaxID=1141098 RepID=A0A1Y2EJG4_9PEZI|nr:tRNA synthetases class I (M)-domain-containing protein [Pseudomassariella vexata]ORY71708.1 tRNA synthetases class I (M)-domain-containing protein [Pseudomassariella vexata]
MRGFASLSTRGLLRLQATAAPRDAWICSSCHYGQVAQLRSAKSFSSSSYRFGKELKDKPFYATTPIFYVNASPHVGHLYTMVLADVLKRWEVLKGGPPALLCTGTDEHGMKVQRAAELQDVAPKVFCDSVAQTFKDLAKKANIANDFFIRTTDPDHRDAVEYFWQTLQAKGFIYETKHEGWYCVSDETFYPENMVTKQVSPTTGKSIMTSIETGNIVKWTEERNYHFRMTELKDRLLDFYKKNPEWVVPASRMAEVVKWVENNLEDLSISRPASRLTWGIPVPNDESQTIYVWVDALINYLTKAGYPNWTPGSEHLGGWPADVQVIGKDIVRFHCVYWPALLMALDLPLPKRILSHAHWLMGQRKMSKSVGNVVNPFFALERWGVDAMRYYLMYCGGIAYDTDYGNYYITQSYVKGLQGGLGNLLNRITRPKVWSVRDAVTHAHEVRRQREPKSTTAKTLAEGIGKTSSPVCETTDLHHKLIASSAETFAEQMAKLNPGGALKGIMEMIFETNAYLQLAKPWDLVKQGEMQLVKEIVYCAAESVRVAGILLQPYMPEKAAGLLDRLGVEPERRTLAYAKLHADDTYGVSRVPLGEGAQSSLFPPIPYQEFDVED